MASSLQQQLAVIAEKSTHQLDLKAQRSQHSQSLLFDPKEAANQTFETVYQIAIDGFEELCMLDSRFVPFAQTLFSEQSRGEDRTQMTAKENEELDQVLHSYLALVSGRLLLSPAQKATEWLVRRFRVHEYNLEHLVLAFLSYHDNPIFATMLSIVSKKRQLPPSLRFLAPYIRSLSVVPRHAILYNIISNNSLFSALNSFVLGAARQRLQSASLLGFWASIMAQAINGQLDNSQSGRPEIRKEREEEVLLRIIPTLQEALQIDIPELYLGCCMIVVILTTKIELADRVLDGLMDAVAANWTTQTINDGLACLSVISQERDSLELPRPTAKKLMNSPQILQRLQEVSTNCPVDRVYSGLAIAYIKGRRPKSRRPQVVADTSRLLSAFITSDFVSDSSKRFVVSILAHRLLEAQGEDEEDSTREELVDATKSLIKDAQFTSIISHVIATERIDTAALESRLQSSLLIEAPSAQESTVVEDVQMQDGGASGSASTAPSLDELQEQLQRCDSFLTNEHTETFDQLSLSFSQAVSAKSDLRVFTEHAALKESTRQLSFLAKVWSTNRSSNVRQQALVAAERFINSSSFATVDCQALLPYLVGALADLQVTVRRAAAKLISVLATSYGRAEKSKQLTDMEIFGKNSVYGAESKAVKWAKAVDVKDLLVEVLSETLEECVLDSANIGRILATALDGSDDDTELKTSTRSSLYTMLISSAVATDLLNVRIKLLDMLSSIGKASAAGRKHVLVPAILDWIKKPDDARTHYCQQHGLKSDDLDRAYIDCLTAETEDEVELIRDVVLCKNASSSRIYDLISSKLVKLWSQISTRQQTHLAQELLNQALAADENVTDQSGLPLALLRQIHLSGDALVTLLQDVHSMASMPDSAPASKRRRTSSSKTRGQDINAADLETMIQRLTLVLELIESSKPERHPELLKHLFHALSDLQHVKAQLGSDLVYLQQMIISALLALVNTLKSVPASKVERSTLRADLVVDCMRSTSSSQVHNSALLLISSMASWAPDLVLHSVMPIFTFMSNTILRQGDDYSAHIIDQTVSHVIPPLVASLRKKNQDLVTGAAELLLSFIAAFEHIPTHRRLQLFKHLVLALGPEESLSAVTAMLFERYPSDRRVPSFCADLANQFLPELQLTATIQYIDLMADILQPRRTVSDAIFTFENNSSEAIADTVHLLTLSLAGFLNEGNLVQQTRAAITRSSSNAAAIQQTIGQLIDRSIGFTKSVEQNGVLRDAGEKVVSAVLDLLPTVDFVSAALPLLKDPEESLGLRLLNALEKRTAEAKQADASTRTCLLNLLSTVSGIVQKTDNKLLKLAGIACMDKIAEKFGKKDIPAVVSVATILSSADVLGSGDVDVQILSYFTLATLVEILRDDMIGLLPGLIKSTLTSLSYAPSQVDGRLWTAAFTFATAVLDYLPWMLNAGMLTSFYKACIDASCDSDLSSRTSAARKGFVTLASKSIDTQICLLAVEQCLDGAFARSLPGVNELLSVLDSITTTATKTAITKNHQKTMSILEQIFDVRAKIVTPVDEDEPEDEDFEETDELRNAVLMKVVLKLNDATFRPWFVHISELAAGEDDAASLEAESHVQRLRGIFGFYQAFFSSLKSLVTGYATYILDNASTCLTTLSPTDESNTKLLQVIVATLSQCFEHDQDDFWQAPSHFDKTSAALLEQLKQAKKISSGDPIGLVPAVAELAAAASSPDHLKALNGELLKMMRAPAAHVRLAAIKCERALTERLGEDWLALLPELLPFISELQEDEDEGVERETLAWIKGVESILGTSLEGMLQ